MKADTRALLVQAVQTNCDIADAHHAADLTLCTYLLQMRELHRWQRAMPFGAALDRATVGAWIAERESSWEPLIGQPYRRLPLADGTASDPFDVEPVNLALQPAGLLYGAGLETGGRPVFFLAERHAQSLRGGHSVQLAGRELARGLQAPVATLAVPAGGAAPGVITVRRESLARWCWERYEAFALRPAEGSAFHAVVQAYGLDTDFIAALPRWLDEQGEAAVLHELGEADAGQRLGPAWAAVRAALPTRRGELFARALRDHLADLQVTLPTLLARDAQASIHVWFANLEGVRALLVPTLPAAYEAWRRGDGGRALRSACGLGCLHFTALAQRALALHAQEGDAAGAAIEQLLQTPAAVFTGQVAMPFALASIRSG